MEFNQIVIQKKALRPMVCVEDAWSTIGANFGTLLGATLVVGLLLLICGVVPYAGFLLNILLAGPLMGGLQNLYRHASDGEVVVFGQVFDGFKNFVPLLIVTVIVNSPMLLLIGLQLLSFLPTGSLIGDISGLPSEVTTGLGVVVVTFFVFVTFLYYFLAFVTYFTYLLIMEHNLDAISAIKLSFKGVIANAGRMILLLILLFVLFLIGALLCLVGLLFFMPLSLLTVANGYRQIYPNLEMEEPDQNPPSPDFYSGMFGQAN